MILPMRKAMFISAPSFGLHFRLYDSVMATNHQAASATMQIGEVAKPTSLTVDAIRFYEKRKLLPTAVRRAGRFRLYGATTVERLHFIQQMRGLGFSLREVGGRSCRQIGRDPVGWFNPESQTHGLSSTGTL